ncbi:MAG: hypothetical protein AAF354_14850 [Pseudomonadota bacterium]
MQAGTGAGNPAASLNGKPAMMISPERREALPPEIVAGFQLKVRAEIREGIWPKAPSRAVSADLFAIPPATY